jgi:hypothetical protein
VSIFSELAFCRADENNRRMNTKHFALISSLIAGGAAVSGLAAEAQKLGYKDTPLIPGTEWHVHDGDRPQPRIVTPGKTFSHLAPPPSDAVVLFDGKDFSKWKGEKGEVGWKIENGYMETTRTGRIRTADEFGDFQLHLEFATPAKVEGSGQGRGNNGVNIYGRYEIQILDSYDNKTYPDGQAGAIYGQCPPLVNASQPPGEWQTYDIIWEGPQWDADGKLTKKANVTVLHNGVVIHHKKELIGNTGHRMVGNYDRPQPPKGYIELYEHGNPVRFRNIWIRPLGEYDKS